MSSADQSRSSPDGVGRSARLVSCAMRVGVGLLLIVALAGCVAGNGGPADASESPATVAPSPTPSLPYTRPPDGGEVKVVEKGFSITRDPYGGIVISYAVVFENTSKLVSHKTRAVVRMLDASGREVENRRLKTPTTRKHKIWYIRPGERFGIAETMYIERTDVDRLEVRIGESEWWPLTVTPVPFPKLEIRDIEIEIESDGSDGAVLEFTVNSHHRDELYDLCVNVMFRDKQGKLVGGGYVSLPIADSFPPGETRTSGEVPRGVPKNFDPSQSDLYATTSVTSCLP